MSEFVARLLAQAQAEANPLAYNTIVLPVLHEGDERELEHALFEALAE